jgi:adenosine deaminase
VTGAASAAHVRALPKCELHVHVEGAAAAATVAELARKHGVDLGVDDPADLYRYRDLADFLRVFDLVCQVLRDVDDIRRVTYESLQIAAAAGVRYREMFFSPTFLMRHGVPFGVIWDGLRGGVDDAEHDHHIVCRLILDVDKPSGPAAARELIDLAAECDRDVLIGIGGDAGEDGFDLAAFADPFAHARRLGFHTTMHLGEEGPASDIAIGLDVVGVERVDHGFSLLADRELTARVAAEGIAFTVCPTSNQMIGLVDDLASHPVIAMRDAGVLVTLNSDNAAMFGIDLADEYSRVADTFGLTLTELEAFALASIDSSWLDDTSRRSYRSAFESEFETLRRSADGC